MQDELTDEFQYRIDHFKDDIQTSTPQANEQSFLITDTVAELQDWYTFKPQKAKQSADNQLNGNIIHSKGTLVNETPRISRNDPCPCGSGKKYKKRCGK